MIPDSLIDLALSHFGIMEPIDRYRENMRKALEAVFEETQKGPSGAALGPLGHRRKDDPPPPYNSPYVG